MGMYTELVLGLEMKINLDEDVVNILKYMSDHSTSFDISKFKEDDFFKCRRWDFLFTCDSYYFSGKTNTIFEFDTIANNYYLTVRSNLKDYDDEIEKFLNWIRPYCEDEGFVGYFRYEEWDNPTLIYFNKDGIELKE